MNTIIEQALYYHDIKNYEQLDRILDNEIKSILNQKRQQEFINYINNSSNICLYKILEDKQIFTNQKSLYIVNEPFIIPNEVNHKLQLISNEQLIKILQKYKKLMKYYKNISIREELLNKENYIIDTLVNKVSIPSTNIIEAINLLGHKKIECKLSNNHPILKIKTKKGEAYLQGIKKYSL